jgi:hypothetical protein
MNFFDDFPDIYKSYSIIWFARLDIALGKDPAERIMIGLQKEQAEKDYEAACRRKDIKEIKEGFRWQFNNQSINCSRVIAPYDSPDVGTIIYCDLGPVEHSGVYVGDNSVVQLNGEGIIEKVSLYQFSHSFLTLNPVIYIPFDEHDKKCFGYETSGVSTFATKKRALKMLGEKRYYNLILDNCHQFSAGCLTGEFENAKNFLYLLKWAVQEYGNNNKPIIWEKWDWIDHILIK